eukprot:9486422-Pyramimonas_sp.AAC.1
MNKHESTRVDTSQHKSTQVSTSPHESARVGTRQYTGYGYQFAYGGDFVDASPRDAFRRRRCATLAFDALNRPGEAQFELAYMMRE